MAMLVFAGVVIPTQEEGVAGGGLEGAVAIVIVGGGRRIRRQAIVVVGFLGGREGGLSLLPSRNHFCDIKLYCYDVVVA